MRNAGDPSHSFGARRMWRPMPRKPAKTQVPIVDMTPETTFVVLFSSATAVAIVVRRFRAPYTVALVVVGLVIGSLHIVAAPHLTKDLLFAIILPGLLFEAAFNLDMRVFWGNRRAIAGLAVPGVIAAIALMAIASAPWSRPRASSTTAPPSCSSR